MKHLVLPLFFCGAFFIFVGGLEPAHADERASDSELASSPTRDPRLPPVLPGETVETESGEKVKVWSSSGSVSVAQPPSAPAPGIPGNIDVFIDRGRRNYNGGEFRDRTQRQRSRYDEGTAPGK